MAQESINQFFAAIKQDAALKEQCQTAGDMQTCVRLAESRGYYFTKEELQAELSKLSEEELAEIINPGIAPRQHIDPQ